MNIKQLNILRVYHLSTGEEMNAGLSWYVNANQEATRLTSLGVTLEQSCAIISAVSPGLKWERTVEAAERIIRGESLAGIGLRWFDGVKKAKRIRAGSNPGSVLRGNKVNAFYACILNPANTVSVCVDGHAYAIWAGNRITLDDVPPMNDRLYSRIASDYSIVAKDIGITPCQLQAITWTTHRRIHGVAMVEQPAPF
jgi:hypothetical protein